MSSFLKLKAIETRIAEFPVGEAALGFVFDELLSATEATKDGRKIVLAGTNNYLGLNHHPDVKNASATATLKMGLGTTGSRLANGSYKIHEGLDRALADFFNCPDAITFSTGYQANLGVLSALSSPNTVFVVDGECHASIFDGCRLGGSRFLRFKHNNVEHLKTVLGSIQNKQVIVVVEGIYSMSGDLAPLKDISDCCRGSGAFLIVDEAHSVGVLGENGRGLAEACDVEDDVDIILGTFSKSLGGVGGFCVSKKVNLTHLKLSARSYIFSASLPPGITEGVLTALELIQSEPDLRHRLQSNIDEVARCMKKFGLESGHPNSPIFSLPLESIERAYEVWNRMMEKRVYTNLVLPPASPNNIPMLRLSMSAAHTKEQIQSIEKALDYAFDNGNDRIENTVERFAGL